MLDTHASVPLTVHVHDLLLASPHAALTSMLAEGNSSAANKQLGNLVNAVLQSEPTNAQLMLQLVSKTHCVILHCHL